MEINGKLYCSRCMRLMEMEGKCPHCGYEGVQERDASVLEEGTLLNGKYQLGAVIGKGGFGITYAAWDENLDRPVAIKEYFPSAYSHRNIDQSDDVEYLEDYKTEYLAGRLRFERESHLLVQLINTPNIVNVLDAFSENNTAYIVMEYIHGVTLTEWMKNQKLKPGQKLQIMRPVMDALVVLHKQGIVHRDLKPDNMLVEEDGTIRLIDFGAAMETQQHGDTIILSRGYAPVEQYGKEYGRQGPWSDVYAFAAVLYELLTGEQVAESILRSQNDQTKSPVTLGVKIGKKQNAALMKALIVQPEKRTQSMDEFRARLFNERLPEEVIQYRRFVTRTISFVSIISLLCILAVINFTVGFPLGNYIRYSLRGDGFHAVGYSGHQEQLSLPESRLGIPVTQIGDGAFQNAGGLSFVELPGTIKTIGSLAFANCADLVNVKLNEGTEEIASLAFANCESLQSVTMPYSILSFQPDSFSGSSERLLLIGALDSHAAVLAEEAKIPFAHLIISENETGVTLLKYETHQENVRIPDMIDGKQITIIGSDEGEAPVFPEDMKNVTLPQYLTEIGDHAFFKSKITQIEFPASLNSIGAYAFSQSFLETLTLPDSVAALGEAAFAACVQLQSVSLSSGMAIVPHGCFEGDTNLTELIVPEGISDIEYLAFSKCERLSFVRLPKGLKRIGQCAFSECVSLDTIYIPHSVSDIHSQAFAGCPNQMIISGYANTYAEEYAQSHHYSYFSMLVYFQDYEDQIRVGKAGGLIVKEEMKTIESLSLPDSYNANPVITIREAKYLKSKNVVLPRKTEIVATISFSGNTYLETVICPGTLKEIQSAAFANCLNLRKIELQEGLDEIGKFAFLDCTNLETIDLPSSLRILGEGAFENCTGLKQINISPSIVNLDNDVFSGTSLTSVIVPGTISMCRTAFYGCKQLEEAVLEEGVRMLLGTFAECENLKTVVIPSTVTEIHASTFRGCTGLHDVWICTKDADLEYSWNAVSHKEYQNETSYILVNLADNPSEYLFCDSPQVTIHCYRGSTAQLLAMQHGIRYELIPEDDSNTQSNLQLSRSNTSSEQIYTQEELLQKLAFTEGMEAEDYFNRFVYYYGYGMMDYANQCLDLYEQAGDDYQKLIAKISKQFLKYSSDHGYTAGDIIVFFEDFKEHPMLLAGDVIVEVDGNRIMNENSLTQLKESSGNDSWLYTILRPDAAGEFEKLTVEVSKADSLVGSMTLWPKTFENQTI